MKKPIIVILGGALLALQGFFRVEQNFRYLEPPSEMKLSDFDSKKTYSPMIKLNGAFALYGRSVVEHQGLKFIPTQLSESTVLTGIYVPLIPADSTEGAYLKQLAAQYGAFNKIPLQATDHIGLSNKTIFLFDRRVRTVGEIPPGVGDAQIVGHIWDNTRKPDFVQGFKEATGGVDVNAITVIYGMNDFNKSFSVYLPLFVIALGLIVSLGGAIWYFRTRSTQS